MLVMYSPQEIKQMRANAEEFRAQAKKLKETHERTTTPEKGFDFAVSHRLQTLHNHADNMDKQARLAERKLMDIAARLIGDFQDGWSSDTGWRKEEK